MAVDRAVFGGITEDDSEQALAALRLDWDEAYEIGVSGGEWHARRLDGGGELAAGTPGSLRRMIRADYDAKPVPRPRRKAADGDCALGTDAGALMAGD